MKLELENEFLEEIKKLGLGEYNKQMIDKASEYAQGVIDDPEENLDAVATIMLDYLNGAAAMLKVLKKQK
ncbi:MAG: hypothetical protein MJZ23_03400 [Paludibacteraceae bacterium]|nr:hypothetical protein [Paludibacteraceae bacterium]